MLTTSLQTGQRDRSYHSLRLLAEAAAGSQRAFVQVLSDAARDVELVLDEVAIGSGGQVRVPENDLDVL